MGVDRDGEIAKMRATHQPSLFRDSSTNLKEIKNVQSQTSMSWKEHDRSKTKSLINFLGKTKTKKVEKPVSPKKEYD